MPQPQYFSIIKHIFNSGKKPTIYFFMKFAQFEECTLWHILWRFQIRVQSSFFFNVLYHSTLETKVSWYLLMVEDWRLSQTWPQLCPAPSDGNSSCPNQSTTDISTLLYLFGYLWWNLSCLWGHTGLLLGGQRTWLLAQRCFCSMVDISQGSWQNLVKYL